VASSNSEETIRASRSTDALEPAPPVSAEAAGDLLTTKHGPVFVCSARDGNINPALTSGQGVYLHDTRYLSQFRLTLDGNDLLLLAASGETGYEAFVQLTNPELKGSNGLVEQMALDVRRHRLVCDGVHERVEVRNHSQERAATEVELVLSADFADIFEVRGINRRLTQGRLLTSTPSPDTARFEYRGGDDIARTTTIEMSPMGETSVEGDALIACWPVELDPHESFVVDLRISLTGGTDARPPEMFEAAAERLRYEKEQWEASCTKFTALHRSFNRFLEAGARDLGVLVTPLGDESIVVAGVPWFAAPFGRDALLTALESLILNPKLARDALLFLAARQATGADVVREAEPGKILHELRGGELANLGLIPHTPYYGSVDATPLYLIVAGAYYRWTDDLETMSLLKPSIEAALSWIDNSGDYDGDGFVEYERRSPAGLINQGWKDSRDAVVHADGTRAEGPIALAEVQGYVYLAKTRIAELYATLGEADRARELVRQSERLKAAFNDAFWMPEEGTFALGLDGSKQQIKSVSSNPGHCLYCAVVDPEKADHVASRLMADDMFSGWGIRTLSSESPAYNPMSYHNGSVWPHDNAIIAAGLKRYGFAEETERIALALSDAANASREARLPELYCGFARRPGIDFVPYPVACRPQAWAAAVPFMILQAMLGLSANASEKALSLHQPKLPHWLGRLEVRDLAVGRSRVALSFSREGDQTAFSLLARDGDLRISH
jgi:glycogen debranching enzyme